ncbi:hypothetical protein [Fusobacterium sp.]|uniref:hypothetical protein n=1 Tax=Fusobacterium sp. TaxID=68766 RepID=UPI0028FDF094|nr:hypothetical protein [Fusobacterium sp.]MDU1909610.1 hypothetical protein [Fusobacterium sp.]
MTRDDFKIIEEKIHLKHAYISDGTHKLKIEKINIQVIDNNPSVLLETESIFTDKHWEEFDKDVYKKFAEDIAKDVRDALNSNSKVKITLFLNKMLGKDKVLLESSY